MKKRILHISSQAPSILPRGKVVVSEDAEALTATVGTRDQGTVEIPSAGGANPPDDFVLALSGVTGEIDASATDPNDGGDMDLVVTIPAGTFDDVYVWEGRTSNNEFVEQIKLYIYCDTGFEFTIDAPGDGSFDPYTGFNAYETQGTAAPAVGPYVTPSTQQERDNIEKLFSEFEDGTITSFDVYIQTTADTAIYT